VTGSGGGGVVVAVGSGGASVGSGGAGIVASGGAPAGTGGATDAAGTGGATDAAGTGGATEAGTGGKTSGAAGHGPGGSGPGSGSGGGASGVSTGGGGTGGPIAVPPGCVLPAVVSYQKDVQPFLITSCGGGNGCHVIDATSTMGSGGYDHGYDWITAGAHTSSCPLGPKRFQVVIDVIKEANPPSCSKSRIMPPPGAGMRAALTACQIATLQAWLDEPLVTQMHRADDSSPTTPYPMPPFN
jgi:hypothetical protein